MILVTHFLCFVPIGPFSYVLSHIYIYGQTRLHYPAWLCVWVIGERSEPLSDKLGGEICIATCALVCIYLYIYMRTA